ncbi:MAG: DUF4178 domain-containing protein [Azoarcus sp.]|jgi:hypothetical protein|nr:DUF4178 domain-containing protein [Azoarcus sp.]
MARVAQCPSCGAEVTFRSAVSVLAVCEYCQTTLLNRNGEIENLGKMAALVDDSSPLRLGSEGRWQSTHFTVIGRLQLKYERGFWNEWFLLFDDQRTGWLSEASGEYSLFFPKRATAPLPAFSTLKPGSSVVLESIRPSPHWTVTNIERAECVAGEGELPFKVGSGYPAPVADLRAGPNMATLDYSEGENKPLLFIGETVDFARLGWANLRDGMPLPAKTKARALRCGQCGAPLDIKHENILAVGCAQCGAVTDAETQKLLSTLKTAIRIKPQIPIGTVGTLQGEKLEVIGFMQRNMTADAIQYVWREYLLAYVRKPGYRWLTEYDGHWNIAEVLSDKVTSPSPFGTSYRGETFQHFQQYKATVDFVIGEFTWRVKVKDEAQLTDYIAPPLMLSCEQTKNEISWSLSTYLEPIEIAQSFGLKTALPAPKGVYANQPTPWVKPRRFAWRVFLFALVMALLLQWRGSQIPQTPYIQENPLFKIGAPWLSEPFTLNKTTTLAVLSEAAGLNNSWIELGLALVNEKDGEARVGSSELSYYSGWDDEGRWTEDAMKRTLVFRDVPSGTWRLMMETTNAEPALKTQLEYAEYSSTKTNIPLTLTVRKRPPPWGNLIILLGTLLLPPLYLTMRAVGFEHARWLESDHPPADSDDD